MKNMKEQILEMVLNNPSLVTRETIAAIADPYKKPVYELGAYCLSIMNDLASNREFFVVNAKYKKAIYDAYVEAGFSEEQAFALIINDNLQLIKNIEKTNKTLENANKKLEV